MSSQDDCSQLATHEIPAAVSHRELLVAVFCQELFVNELQSLLYTLDLIRGNASTVASLLTRSRDPFPLLRNPSVYSCCLATNEERRCEERRCEERRCEERRCEEMRDSSRHGRARLGSEGENTASSTVA
jgi:hypothetical protein